MSKVPFVPHVSQDDGRQSAGGPLRSGIAGALHWSGTGL